MPDEVAVFIDLENLRYSLLNTYGQEPNFSSLVSKATKYGRPTIMRAYADFSEHPPELTRQLQVAGIEAINIPVKRRTYQRGGKPIERVKNAADMVLALDALLEALDADTNGRVKVFLLVAGDADYIKLVTQLRNRFGQRVVIAGVPRSTASDLVVAAGGESDPVEVAPQVAVDEQVLKKAIVEMVRKGPTPLKYWTVKVIDQWSQDARQNIPGTAKERRDAIGELLKEGVLEKRPIDVESGRQATETFLNEAKAQQLQYI